VEHRESFHGGFTVGESWWGVCRKYLIFWVGMNADLVRLRAHQISDVEVVTGA